MESCMHFENDCGVWMSKFLWITLNFDISLILEIISKSLVKIFQSIGHYSLDGRKLCNPKETSGL